MALEWQPDQFGAALGGLLLFALAAFTFSLRPRSRTTVAFGIFCAAYGLSVGPLVLVPIDEPLFALVLVVYTVADLVTAAFMALVALALPRPFPVERRRLLLIPLVLALTYTVLCIVVAVQESGAFYARYRSDGVASELFVLRLIDEEIFLHLTAASGLFGIALLALRHGLLATDAVTRRQGAILAVALAFHVASFMLTYGHYPGEVRLVAVWALLSLAACLWLWAGARHPEASRTARNVALVTFALPVILQGAHLIGLGDAAWGAFRTAGVLFLAYGVLRQRLLGLEPKIRWGISRGTLAGLFFAVFFVFSEAAPLVLGAGFEDGSLGIPNEYLGILAAGALMFFIAPLSRLADRIATHAVPVAPGVLRTEGERAGAAYRVAVRAALADGSMTPEKEDLLAELQEHLGLRPLDAVSIRREVEGEKGGTR